MLERTPALLHMRFETILGANTADLRGMQQPHERFPIDLGEIAACTTTLIMSQPPYTVMTSNLTVSIYIDKCKSKLHAYLERPLSVRWSIRVIIRWTVPQSHVETQAIIMSCLPAVRYLGNIAS